MTVPGENIAPRAGAGAAFLLPQNTPNALAILMAGQRTRAAAERANALARQREAERIGKQYDEDKKINYDAGGLFQESYNDYTAPIPGQLADKYAQLSRGQIDRAQLNRDVANLKGEVERERLLSIDRHKDMDQYMTKEGANPFRDRAELRTALGHSVLTTDPATQKVRRVRASEYDPMKVQAEFDQNPMTYNPATIFEDYARKQASNTIDEAHQGRIGGSHSSSSLTYKGMIPVKRDDGTWDVMRDGAGRPVVSIDANTLATERQSNHPLDMGIRRLELIEKKAAEQEGRQPLSALELFQRDAGKYFSFKQNDSAGLNAQPHVGRASARPKAADIIADNGEVGDYTHQVQFDNGMHDWNTAKPLYPGGVPLHPQKITSQGIETLGAGTKPRTVGGKDVTTTGAIFPELGRPDANGKMVYVKNDKPIAGSYQHYFYDAVDENGHQVEGKTKAEKQQMIKEGKAKEGMFVVISGTGNKDYSAAVDENYKSLKASNDLKYPEQRKSDAELKAKAEDLAMKGSEMLTVPYNGSTAPRIDSDTHGYYKPAFRKLLQRRAAPKGTQKADPLGFTPKAAPAPAAAPAAPHKAKANPLGF